MGNNTYFDHAFTVGNIFEQVTQMTCFDLLHLVLHKRMLGMNQYNRCGLSKFRMSNTPPHRPPHQKNILLDFKYIDLKFKD